MSIRLNMISIARWTLLSPDEIHVPQNYIKSNLSPRLEQALEEAIKEIGFTEPIVVCVEFPTGRYRLVDGYHRLELAKRLKMTKIPAVNIGQCNEDQAKLLNVLHNYIKGPALRKDLILTLLDIAETEDPERLARLLGRTKRFVYYLRDIKRFIPREIIENLLSEGVSLRFLIDASQIIKKYYETVKNCIDVLIDYVRETSTPWKIVESKLSLIRKIGDKEPRAINDPLVFKTLLKASINDLEYIAHYPDVVDLIREKMKKHSDTIFAIAEAILEHKKAKTEEIVQKHFTPPPEPQEVKVEVKQLHEEQPKEEVKPLLEQVESKPEAKTEEVDYASIAFEVYKKLMEINKIIHKIERTEDREKQRQYLKEVRVLLKILVDKLEEKLK